MLALSGPAIAAAAAATEAADEAPQAKTLDTLEVTGQRQSGYTAEQTATATRLQLSPHETPQSISVVTRQQMDDFGLNSVNDVLNASTGVTVESVETDRTYYTARGFDITNFQVDGLGLPFTYGLQGGDLDTAAYERVEVLRGANGLMSSTGNPSATINFVRKRATADFQGSAALGLGRWDTRRFDLDLSGPLARDGRLRGRLVAADEEGDSHLDRYSHRKQLFYGVLEADLGDSTTLAVGASRQNNDADSPLWGALPLYYSDGTPTRYDRSTSTATDWAFWDIDDSRAFIELEQRLGGDWRLKASLNYRESEGDSELFYIYGTPERATGLGLYAYPSLYRDNNRERYADVYASGGFDLGGRRHDLVFGVNWGAHDTRELSWYSADIGTALPDLAGWDGRYPKPAFDAYSQSALFDMIRRSAYATARWNLSDRFKLITGANFTDIRSRGESYGEPHAYEDSHTTPFVGAVLDLGQAYSLYASYGRIFNPQTERDIEQQVLDPITGSHLEAGIKAQWLDGRLNASAAVFRVKQDNTAESAGFDPELATSYYAGVDAESTGYELEISGLLTPDWDLTAGWTQLRIEGEHGEDVRTYVPRRTFRLFTSYRVPLLPGLKLGASLRWQDDIHRDPGVVDSAGNPVRIRQDAYAVLGLMAHYDFSPRWSTTLNVDNASDRSYIPSLYWDQGYYAAPRNATLTVRYAF